MYIFMKKIKVLTKWKYLFLRNNWSTIISQAVDTLIFTFVWLTTIWNFKWIIEIDYFWQIVFATYIIKLIVALIDTPFIYLSHKFKK